MESPRDNNTRGESYKDIAQRPDSNIIYHVRSLFPGTRRDHKASLHTRYHELYSVSISKYSHFHLFQRAHDHLRLYCLYPA